MITEKEREFLKATVLKPSNFNCDKLDFSKSWNEQELESDEWYSFGEARDYGWKNKKEWSGLCSSLIQKGLIKTYEDEESEPPFKTFVWLVVGEEEFNNLKKEFGF